MGVMKRLAGQRQQRSSSSERIGMRAGPGAAVSHVSPGGNKKGHTGARAGIGHGGRAPTTFGHPHGPAGAFHAVGVRLPNRGSSAPARTGFFGRLRSFFGGGR